jgi:hypothetical protein
MTSLKQRRSTGLWDFLGKANFHEVATLVSSSGGATSIIFARHNAAQKQTAGDRRVSVSEKLMRVHPLTRCIVHPSALPLSTSRPLHAHGMVDSHALTINNFLIRPSSLLPQHVALS